MMDATKWAENSQEIHKKVFMKSLKDRYDVVIIFTGAYSLA